MIETLKKIRSAIPFLILTVIIFTLWWAISTISQVPAYLLPTPEDVVISMVENKYSLFDALSYTLFVTFIAFVISAISGIFLSIFLIQARWLESAVMPYVVVIQVTPFVAVAPLLQLWARNISTAVIILAIIASIFPIITNTMLGLHSAEEGLQNLFSMYHASRIQRLRYLLLPGALPNIITGLKVGLGLALIGAVVAQFLLANSQSNGGISYIIMQSEYNLETANMFAALLLLVMSGALLFILASRIGSFTVRKWHQSEIHF